MRIRRAIPTLLLLIAAAALTAGADRLRWRTYENCRLIEHPANDGDSFHVKTPRRHFIFRLYFVDAPETDFLVPERVTEQAAYWGVDEARAIALGAEAAAFASEFLKGGFAVLSRKEDARGQSDQPRYYALVRAGGRDLGEALVARGLARIYGMPAKLPEGESARRYRAALKAAEQAAKRQGLGGWARRLKPAGTEPPRARAQTATNTAVDAAEPSRDTGPAGSD